MILSAFEKACKEALEERDLLERVKGVYRLDYHARLILGLRKLATSTHVQVGQGPGTSRVNCDATRLRVSVISAWQLQTT
jgi:hypothetical protein